LEITGYDQIVMAAVEGHGIALGRSALVGAHLRSGKLVAPFTAAAESARAYYVLASRHAGAMSEAGPFVAWLKREAAGEDGTTA
jgi:DNA-binding transcriptional LysR family regulator